MQRVSTIVGAMALLAAAATATAAVGDVSGTVTHVHPQGNIVEFNDGRTIYLEPGATFTVDGRQVTIDQIRPGMRVVVSGARDAQSAPAAVAAPTSHPPINAAGTVTRFDPQTNTVTFQDGRMLKLGPQASVWTQGQREAIGPGERILVRGAQPTGYRAAWDSTTTPRHRMGTVTSVDPASAVVILSDGTIVRVSQATKLQVEGQPFTLSELRPGDEVVIVGTARPVASTGAAAGMASPGAGGSTVRAGSLPSFFTATFDASEIHLMRRQQAP